MPGILPEMSIDESLDVTRIYSVADQLPAGTPLIRHRPFRAPHHTISHAGLVATFQSPVKYLSLTGVFCFWMNSPNSGRASWK
jgi:predicted ATPase with chaperone activity